MTLFEAFSQSNLKTSVKSTDHRYQKLELVHLFARKVQLRWMVQTASYVEAVLTRFGSLCGHPDLCFQLLDRLSNRLYFCRIFLAGSRPLITHDRAG